MPVYASAEDTANQILLGFSEYRAKFHAITQGAQARFEQALWHQTQTAAADRIKLYEECVLAQSLRLAKTLKADTDFWQRVKGAYITLLATRDDAELAETWYNSIFFRLLDHERCVYVFA